METKEERRSRIIFNVTISFIVISLIFGGLYASRNTISEYFEEKHIIHFDDEYLSVMLQQETEMLDTVSIGDGKTYHFLDPEIEMIDEMLAENLAYMDDVMKIRHEDPESEEYKLLMLQYVDRTNMYLQSMRLLLTGETTIYPNSDLRYELTEKILEEQSRFIYEPK